MPNPFFHRGPIRDPAYFYGRQRETYQTLDLLRSAQSVSIVGPRRIGKTSLLFYLTAPDLFSQHGLTVGRHCFVYVDCESWSRLERNELYAILLDEMWEALTKAGHSIERTSLPSTSTTYRIFEQTIRTVVQQRIQLIFLLDEFETLSLNPHLDADFFSGLRGLATRHGVAYVTASTELLLNLTYFQASVLSSPFFNFFAQVRLRPFLVSEAEELLTGLATLGGTTFSPATIEFLLDLAGPHPLLLQLAAYQAFDLKAASDAPLSETEQATVRRRFWAEARTHWTYTWRSLSPQDQKHLVLLPLARRSEPEAVRRLEDAGVVLQRDNDFILLSSSFRKFVAQQSVPGVVQAPPVILDLDQRITLLGDQPLALTPTEFDLLACLVAQAGQVVPHLALESQVWPNEYVEDPDRLKTTIKTLRRALGQDARYIQNVRGVGYKFSSFP